MKKSEIYSWRVARELKSALQQEARREGSSIGGLLERIALEWLKLRRAAAGNEGEQERLHAAAARAFGTISGGNPNRSTEISSAVRRRLSDRRAR
jgi:hypothetical protein